MQRRDFLGIVGRGVPGAVLVSAAAGTYAVAVEPSWIEVRRLRVPVRHLDPALDGLRVLQISDIHRSAVVSGRFVEEAVETAVALKPELIVITGDFITSDPANFVSLSRELKALGGAAPSFAVPGNHDYGHIYPWADAHCPEGGDRLKVALARADIELLRNERRTVPLRGAGAVEIVGLDDFWSPHFDPRRAFAAGDAGPMAAGGPARLVLSHNPDSFRAISRYPFDLLFCGHTHGGQVRLPLLGAPVVPVEDRRFIAGLVAAEDRLVYINRGLGYSRRIRFGVRPEITLMELAVSA
jgi:uncharacterized protein